jgi:hypothetical protein
MADGAHRIIGFRVEKAVWLPSIWIAGCPEGQSRKNVPV